MTDLRARLAELIALGCLYVLMTAPIVMLLFTFLLLFNILPDNWYRHD
jgi:hypothetical protein